jgi:uncharacterized protein
MRERLRAALPRALKQRDVALVAALRTTLADLDNAEAVPSADDQRSLALEETPVGVGVQEVARRDLSEADVARLVRAAIDERRAAAEVYEQAGEHERARRLRHEDDTLADVAALPSPTDPPAVDR